MNLSSLWLAVACLALTPVPAWAVDLTKIDRTIAKEPTYQSKAPKYYLLVLGPEAKTRVWLVLDGDVLYVDRNGNGDLTDAGERLTRTDRPDLGEDRIIVFHIGDLTESDGKAKHAEVNLSITRDAKKEKASLSTLQADVNRMYLQVAKGGAFADRPQDAPIVHLNALTMGLLNLHDYRFLEALARGERNLFLYAGIGTVDKDTMQMNSVVDHRPCPLIDPRVLGVPSGIHPVAEITFPNKNLKGKPITIQVVLAKRTG